MSLRRKDLKGANLSLERRRSARLQKRLRTHAKEVDRSNKVMPKAKIKKRGASDLAYTPFMVECPVLQKRRECNVAGGVFKPEHEDGGFGNLDITYVVCGRRGKAWEALRSYKNFISKHAHPIALTFCCQLANVCSWRGKVPRWVLCLC
jgi:hypothetical protein